MSKFELKRMSPEVFADWRENLVRTYATANIESGRWAKETAMQASEEVTAKLLSAGIDTPDHHLWSIFSSNEIVGDVWFMIQKIENQPLRAFTYNIDIARDKRGLGFGKLAMLAIEVEAKKLGATSMALHVFSYNKVAHELYKKLGYKSTEVFEVSQVMEKPLSAE